MSRLHGIVSLIITVACFRTAWKSRIDWWQLSPERRRLLIITSSVLCCLSAFFLFTQWQLTSHLSQEVLYSASIGGYTFLVLLLTLLRPKVLLRLLATLLLLPVLLVLILVPLSATLHDPVRMEHFTRSLFVSRAHWDYGAFGSSGTAMVIYDRPCFFPFIQRYVTAVNFDDTKCMADQAFLVLQADGRHAMARCPWKDYEHRQGYHDFLIPLY